MLRRPYILIFFIPNRLDHSSVSRSCCAFCSLLISASILACRKQPHDHCITHAQLRWVAMVCSCVLIASIFSAWAFICCFIPSFCCLNSCNMSMIGASSLLAAGDVASDDSSVIAGSPPGDTYQSRGGKGKIISWG